MEIMGFEPNPLDSQAGTHLSFLHSRAGHGGAREKPAEISLTAAYIAFSLPVWSGLLCCVLYGVIIFSFL